MLIRLFSLILAYLQNRDAPSPSESSEDTPRFSDSGFQIIETSLPQVLVETDAFEAEVIGLYSMPANRVMDAVGTMDQTRLDKMVSLFKLALVDPKNADRLDTLTFGELSEVLQQWVELSGPAEEARLNERGTGDYL